MSTHHGAVLLVGEGNFSFSAALTGLSPDPESSISITATCLQSPEEALQHEGTAANIQIIKDSGGVVLYEVDSTKLGEFAALQGLVFDRVVFNFPHCGRKSGVKKNRELLKSFFLSCVQVLSEEGEVHVALCNGQGGTPADRPQRDWHNSWQVVAMAAEAELILSHVQPFDDEKYKDYRCTGYRSQDKGFHVEKGLLHVFTRSLPIGAAPKITVEETVEAERVGYDPPAELSDYIFRGFLSPTSVHPVRLVQTFMLKGLAEKWTVSMMSESLPFLLTPKQLQRCSHQIDDTQCYQIHHPHSNLPTPGHPSTEAHSDGDIQKDPSVLLDGHESPDTLVTLLSTCIVSDKVSKAKSQVAESARSACCLETDFEEARGVFVLRPSLLPQMEELLTRMREEEPRRGLKSAAENHREREDNGGDVEAKGNEAPNGDGNDFTELLFGISGLVFKNVPISPWAPPAFHQLVLCGVFPVECEPIRSLGQSLETLLAPYGVTLVTAHGHLCLTAQPMGLLGEVFGSDVGDSTSHISVSVALNLDLLAVLLFSLPDWRLLWTRDPRFPKHVEPCPSPGEPLCPFSLFPQHFDFDISFWAGPAWEEKDFHAVVREASNGTVNQVKLIDTFSHPDLIQTSYCYRLTYHSHTHALSHTRALHLHGCLESLLSSRLQVTIR